MAITLIVLAVTICLFVTGKVRSDLIALTALVVLMLAWVLTPEEALSGFSNALVVMMMIGLFVVGGAVGANMYFASPFSTPPNALVMSAGRYNYVKVGLPLQLFFAIAMAFLLPLFFPF